MSAGTNHTCGIKKSDDSVVCWGNNDKGQLDAPSGEFSQISAGDNRSCGIKTDGSVVCWGENSDQVTYLDDTYSQISVSNHDVCGIRTDGYVICVRNTFPSGTFSQVSVAQYGRICGIKMDGSVSCIGSMGSNPNLSGIFSQINSGGEENLCGIKTNGSVICHDRQDSYGIHLVPSGTFSQVEVSYSHACGLKTDSSVVCWGNNHGIPPSDKTFVQVTAGNYHSLLWNQNRRFRGMLGQ